MSNDSNNRNTIADRFTIHLLEGEGIKDRWVTICCNGVSITWDVSPELYAHLKEAFEANYITFRG